MSIAAQVEHGLAFLRGRYGARSFLLYFQAFSNTYAPPAELRRIYDAGLEQAPFRGLIVATRPDCIDEERAALLAGYLDRGLDVWVELGLQSANDETLRRIRRGHTREQFDQAVRLLHCKGINVAAHLILGLPGEGVDAVVQSAEHLSRLPVGGVKFHNLVVVEGTPLYELYAAGRFVPPDTARYRELLISALEHLRGDMVVMRLTCDPPRRARFVPAELPDKAELYRWLATEFAVRRTRQGIYWSEYADEG